MRLGTRSLLVFVSGLLALVTLVGCENQESAEASAGASGLVNTSEVSSSPGTEGWRTVDFDSVRVDVPSTWAASWNRKCGSQWPRWGPPGSRRCKSNLGLRVYTSGVIETFIPPGLHPPTSTAPDLWTGYVDFEGATVFVSHPDQAVVKRVMDSVRHG